MKQKVLSGLCTAVLLAAPLATARADILYFDTFGAFSAALQQYGGTLQNVLTPGAATGTTVSGFTNQTNSQVNVQSLTAAQLSVASANGQAVFTGAGGGNIGTGGFNIFLPNNATFTALAFNLDNVQGSTGTEVISVTEPAGSPTPGTTMFNSVIGNGANFVGILAINNQTISNVRVSGPVNLADLAQVRVGGLGVSTVPEPSTYALMATGLVALGGFARRRRQV
jgi:hypothetical protein